MKKKIAVLICTIALGISGAVLPASADTYGYWWEFTSTNMTHRLGDGYKDDMEQNYYLTIGTAPGAAISATNKFGTRIRRSSDNAFVSNYVVHTSTKNSQPYGYTSYANTSTAYHMRGKKDSTSTSTRVLVVQGKTTY